MRISDWSSDVCSSDLPGEDPPVRLSPLLRGYPARQELVAAWIDDRFADAEREAGQRQQQQRGAALRMDERRRGGEHAPPQQRATQHDARHVARPETARRHLEQRIATQEGASNPAPPTIVSG